MANLYFMKVFFAIDSKVKTLLQFLISDITILIYSLFIRDLENARPNKNNCFALRIFLLIL